MPLLLKNKTPSMFLLKASLIYYFYPEKIEIQNTKAILDILDPIVFPIAKIVSFCSAASTEIKISGADVAIPIKKKLAIKPEIEKYFEKLSVEVTKKFDPRINNESPTNSKNRASSIAKK